MAVAPFPRGGHKRAFFFFVLPCDERGVSARSAPSITPLDFGLPGATRKCRRTLVVA